ncbi:hypothetical protein TPHA_0A00840 [Tetrapisispora phaffii CBS 4417]|uniref:ABC transporter domain-containing protein n=1 Tax=Tetrapisispora phaffii (strain ATCC 24235 / CBS 4417 / NBRC 1672 / NRRL Y-8282 / UCD 70-5) TaxID=1071381 RepID=G8BMP1_TETPH|nr:hypothetical protein TPHA_0A00840 [Tetrapisispora phaffii CBS 4417]CCE61169.1 hypothetical protein TPHA_0A00840 [Tetrapisispora phaffii CBS 4417]
MSPERNPTTTLDDTEENHIKFKPTNKVSLHVRDLTITASKSKKTLIRDFSIDLPSGSVMAVIGGSGSGKTTLLNVLASKISGGLSYTGDISYIADNNSSTTSSNPYEKVSVTSDTFSLSSTSQESIASSHASMAYLPQQDVLAPKLTCRETLMYSAELKLQQSKEENAKLVDELIYELGLIDCADTLVGDSSHRGLSGGEKRRLSIGTQMISNPSLMYLDEPTTGLDAYSAFLVIKTIKRLAQFGGRTFIMSIHQPRSDILFLFDKLCILSRGSIVFCDDTTYAIPYFEKLGYTVPQLVNPADYLIDISSVDSRKDDSKILTEDRLDFLVKSWKEHELSTNKFIKFDKSNEVNVKTMSASVPYLKQVSILVRRNNKLYRNDYVTMIATFMEPSIMGTITGWIFYKTDINTTSGLRSRTSCLYSSIILQSYLYLLFDTYRLCEQDIALYDRERAEGTVTPVSFVTARKISLFFSDDLMMVLIFVVITYFMFGLEADAKKFFFHFVVIFLIQLSSSGLALLSVAVSRDFSKASLVGNLSYTLLSLASGFFVNAKKTPVYVRWTKYISFSWFGFGALMSNTFTNEGCHTDNLDECIGNELLDSYGFPRHWKTVPAVVLLCWVIGYMSAALFMFYVKKVDITLQNEIKSKKKNILKDDKSTSANTLGLTDVKSVQHENSLMSFTSKNDDLEAKGLKKSNITVTLRNIKLSVTYLQFFSNIKTGLYHHHTKEILNSINATFKPGMINAIMGPSGSGKSSLLNLISAKQKSSMFATFSKEGSIALNDNEISEEMFKSLCAYVSQDDDHLLSKLTVRESFKFAADLRLHYMCSDERDEKIDTLIRALGLTNCQNTIIGDEFVKGISGGEKRRVSMGIQLLKDPPILLLDEPTSGLDSFTSLTVLEILEQLSADFGKTVIITIHQPRAELFKKFGNVLLLAKSGRTAFNGSPKEMINYFKNLGYVCPAFTNIADYFLDIISLNKQNEKNTEISTKRVTSIIDSWNNHFKELNIDTPQKENKVMVDEQFLNEYGDVIRAPCNIAVAYFVNVKRQFTTTRRNFDSLMARIAQVPGLGVIFALFWAPLRNTYAGVNNRLGLAQESTALYFVGMLANLACYPKERNYFYEEYHDGVYGIAPFFLAYMTLELPLSALSSLIYSVFTVMVCGLPRTPGNFFVTAYCSLAIVSCGEALGIITNTFFERPGFVVNCISVVLSIGTQMSGLLSLDLSRVLKGFNYLNPLNYTSLVIINYAFPSDLTFTCNDGGRLEDGTCEFANGTSVLESYNLVVNTSHYLGIIVCVAFIYRTIAYLILKAKLEWIKW